jgi:hypothetical protein
MMLFRIIGLDSDNLEDAIEGLDVTPEFDSCVYCDTEQEDGHTYHKVYATDDDRVFRGFSYISSWIAALRNRKDRIVNGLFSQREHKAIYVYGLFPDDPEGASWEIMEEYLLCCDLSADEVRSIASSFI